MSTGPDAPSTWKGPDPDFPPTIDGAELLDPAEAMAEELAGALADDWRAGRRRRVEDLLETYPKVRDHPRAAVRLIYEEICLRQEEEPDPLTAEMLGRFPRYRDEIRVILAGHHLIEDELAAPVFPKVGETLGDARLLAEMGRGALGRVFLATQTGLGDRPVVLKVSPRRGDEHLSLARLQHAHIVPLYGTNEFPDLGLRVLCMPYHGSLTLARLTRTLNTIPPALRTGSDILEALDRSHTGLPVEIPAVGPARSWLARASYVQAISWIGACLARALHHAHTRNLVHLDLKPSNILLAADGQPMLLDFHLARRPIRPEDTNPGAIGGTPIYMSPEQADALDRAREGFGPRSVVDGRSDLFSLGMVLYQTLGGSLPPPPSHRRVARTLRKANPKVSTGLADLIAKCLASDPRDRYADASTMAEDLRRHLLDHPLQGVSNRSPAERWRKWRRRRPHVLAIVAMTLVVLTAAATVAVVAWMASAPPRAVAIVARSSPDQSRRAEAANRLSLVVARIRHEVAPDRRLGPATTRELAQLCREIWTDRERFLGSRDAPLPDPTAKRAREDLIDLVALSIDLEARSQPDDPAQIRLDGLRRLDEAAACLGPSPILDLARSSLLSSAPAGRPHH